MKCPPCRGLGYLPNGEKCDTCDRFASDLAARSYQLARAVLSDAGRAVTYRIARAILADPDLKASV